MRGMEDAQMTTFEISPKFTLFGVHIGAKKGGARGEEGAKWVVPITQ